MAHCRARSPDRAADFALAALVPAKCRPQRYGSSGRPSPTGCSLVLTGLPPRGGYRPQAAGEDVFLDTLSILKIFCPLKIDFRIGGSFFLDKAAATFYNERKGSRR